MGENGAERAGKMQEEKVHMEVSNKMREIERGNLDGIYDVRNNSNLFLHTRHALAVRCKCSHLRRAINVCCKWFY